jgi:hypothetical protein
MATEATTEALRPLEKAALLRSQLADRLAGDLAAFVKKAWSGAGITTCSAST